MPETEYGAPLAIQEVKATGDAFEVAGYASTWGNVDHGGDVVVKGAFDGTLTSGRKVRFLYSHDPRQVLGVPLSLKADDDGLHGRFKISRTRLGEEVHQLLKDGALDSFSIGYVPTDVEYDDDVRLLKSVDLLEVSIVSMPMNPRARVTAVKAITPEDAAQMPFVDLWQRINESLQVGVSEAKALRERRQSRKSGVRELADSHIEALTAGIAEAEALLDELRALVVVAPDPQQAKAAGDLHLRLELAKRRLRSAGLLGALEASPT